VPTTVELARNDDDRQIMKLFAVGSDIGRSIIAPPGVPAERVAILRRAFMDTMNDPEFIAAAKKSEFDLEPMNGADLQSMINGIGGMQPELLRKAAEAKKWSR
jgi:tripartite-type tricarboxylate transporter receptor subunit TctC